MIQDSSVGQYKSEKSLGIHIKNTNRWRGEGRGREKRMRGGGRDARGKGGRGNYLASSTELIPTSMTTAPGFSQLACWLT